MKIREVLAVLIIIGIITLVGNFVGANIPMIDAIPGMIFLIAISILGVIFAKNHPGQDSCCSLHRYNRMHSNYSRISWCNNF